MAATNVRGGQIGDGTVQRVDLDVATIGQAVIRKIVQGTNITISSTGADSGTGDVTINAAGGSATDYVIGGYVKGEVLTDATGNAITSS